MTKFEWIQSNLRSNPKTWLVTGCAGFIGSNLLEALLGLDQTVVGLDNLSTGYEHNLDAVRAEVSESQWRRFHFIRGDVRDFGACQEAVAGVDNVLHQAALGSVPRSIQDPIASNDSNVNGFLNMLVAARDARVASFVYAASSSTYGDHPALPKVEANIGRPLSPYAVTKYVNELYADVFARSYGFRATGLRYFNVFGKRQDPNGGYAAVIPKWIAAMIEDKPVIINGDGNTSRDFCYVDNAVQANLLASTVSRNELSEIGSEIGNEIGGEIGSEVRSEIYNVAVSDATTLNGLFGHLKQILEANGVDVSRNPVYTAFRPGDVRHSQADIGKAQRQLGYAPGYRLYDGLKVTVPWYIDKMRQAAPSAAMHDGAAAAAARHLPADAALLAMRRSISGNA